MKRLLGVGLFGTIIAAFAKRKRRAVELSAQTRPPSSTPPVSHTSPHTVPEHLEARRAREAAVRERESQESSETKFEELRREQEAELAEHSSTLGEPPPPRD
jgi:hypothetical protein